MGLVIQTIATATGRLKRNHAAVIATSIICQGQGTNAKKAPAANPRTVGRRLKCHTLGSCRRSPRKRRRLCVRNACVSDKRRCKNDFREDFDSIVSLQPLHFSNYQKEAKRFYFDKTGSCCRFVALTDNLAQKSHQFLGVERYRIKNQPWFSQLARHLKEYKIRSWCYCITGFSLSCKKTVAIASALRQQYSGAGSFPSFQVTVCLLCIG